MGDDEFLIVSDTFQAKSAPLSPISMRAPLGVLFDYEPECKLLGEQVHICSTSELT